MKLNDYQLGAMEFAKYRNNDYPFLALSEEVGEVSGKLAKYVRKNKCSLSTAIFAAVNGSCNNSKALRNDLKKELGDVLWQLQACCAELDFSLEEVAELNLDKLSGRSDRGTIVGEGDER
ncbi:hypothetical protein [Pseudoalteromonas phage H103]|uniref:MazG-like pyrophosphatase n=1 Tax=Pseudoalteromonas phage H103 TaxID=1636200 RepID=UPI0006BC43AA|nr:MazG-like pyrophosphatase [Pseudoalteromonas phage H103]AKA61247.1 hypothetical protein [Pseudoalteromonas phage H103]